MSHWPYFLSSVDLQNGSVEVNLTEWLLTTNSNNNITSDEQDTALDLAASLLVGIFLAVIIFLSVAGNLLVCIAVYTDRTLRKVGNLFIVSLAISDLFVACLVMVFAVANDLQGSWIFGDQFCDIWVAFDVMCCTASILNLCAISMDRYIHIKDPLRYGRWMTKRVIYSSIAAIWLLAALISFLPISMDLHRPVHEMTLQLDDQPLESTFDEDLGILSSDMMANTPVDAYTVTKMGNENEESADNEGLNSQSVLTIAPSSHQCALDLTPTYAVVSSCISFYLPCLVMLAIYSRLYFYAKMHVQNIKAVTRPVILLGRFEPDANDSGASDPSLPQEEKLKKKKKKRRHYQSPTPPGTSASSTTGQNCYHVSDHKAAVTLGIIMGVFLICWVPFFCVNIVAAFCKTCIPPIVFKILTWLGYSNSAFNPIIYSIFNLDFRLAFQKILTAKTRSYCCHRLPDIYESRSRGNSGQNGGAAMQGSSNQMHPQLSMDHLRSNQEQLLSNGHHQMQQQVSQQTAVTDNEEGHHLGRPCCEQDDVNAPCTSVLVVSTSSGHITSSNNLMKPHHHIRRTSNSTTHRKDSGQHLLVAEKVV